MTAALRPYTTPHLTLLPYYLTLTTPHYTIPYSYHTTLPPYHLTPLYSDYTTPPYHLTLTTLLFLLLHLTLITLHHTTLHLTTPYLTFITLHLTLTTPHHTTSHDTTVTVQSLHCHHVTQGGITQQNITPRALAHIIPAALLLPYCALCDERFFIY